MRLAYFERLERTIPRELISFMPEKTKPNFKVMQGTKAEGKPNIPSSSCTHFSLVSAAALIHNKIKNRVDSSQDVEAWLQSAEGKLFMWLS